MSHFAATHFAATHFASTHFRSRHFGRVTLRKPPAGGTYDLLQKSKQYTIDTRLDLGQGLVKREVAEILSILGAIDYYFD